MKRKHALLLTPILLGGLGIVSAQHIDLVDLPKVAIEKSQITLPGSRPFHLKANVFQSTDLDNDNYNAEIEEYWLAPNRWRRTIKSADFSQTLIVDGDQVSEQLAGDYYPNWLHTIVSGIFDPGAALQGLDLSQPSDNPMIGGALKCRRFDTKVGISPALNDVFSTYCFAGDLLDSVGKPGYEVQYSHYEKFTDKFVARTLNEYIEPGTEVGATILNLDELNSPDNSLFRLERPGAELRTVILSEETLRANAAEAPPMNWPVIQGGIAVGLVSIYVCVDRGGRVRETYGLNSHHPDMADAARAQVAQWRFKPYSVDGKAVQVESILTFAYQAKIVPKPSDGDSY